MDFSGNLANRKSYKVSRRKRKEEFAGFGAQPSEERNEAETFEEKVARLQREVEEVKLEQAQRDGERQREEDDMVRSLYQSLRTLDDDRPLDTDRDAQANGNITERDASTNSAQISAQDLLSQSLPDPAQTTRTLTLAAELETRLSALEKALGLPALSLPNQLPTRPVLPQLQTLDRQLTVLSNTTGPSLTALNTQVQSLTQSAESLTTARKNALQAKDDLRIHARQSSQASFHRPMSGQSFSHSRPSSYYGAGFRPSVSRQATHTAEDGEPGTSSLDQTAQTLLAGEETEQSAQVRKLYEQIPTIEALSPLVPGLLDRLRSLHPLHAGAASAAESLDEVEKRQSEMGEDLEKWKESLSGLDKRLEEGDGRRTGNKQAVEGWIRELEARLSKLDET